MMKKVIFAILFCVIVFSSCKKDDRIAEVTCVSDCYEISGSVINKSTNLPDANRRIKVQAFRNVYPFTMLDRGYVTTKPDGTYSVKISKASFADTSKLCFALTPENKDGYLNDFFYNVAFFENLSLNQLLVKDFYVYDATTLKVIVNNKYLSDSVEVYDISYKIENVVANKEINKKFAFGESDTLSFSTAAGVYTKVELMYMKKDSPIYVFFKTDSLLCSKTTNNLIELNIK